MRFVSGSRHRSVTYVIRPAVPQRDPLTGRQMGTHPALRAEFKDHVFNSETAQRTYRWSDAEREEVESYLLNHPDFGRGDGRGMFLDKTATFNPRAADELNNQIEQDIARSALAEKRCEFFFEAGDQMVQCDLTMPVTEESDFCEKHQGVMVAAGVSTEE